MSLKAVHIFLILCSILLCFIFGSWAIRNVLSGGETIYGLLGALALAGALVLVYYLYWFVRKRPGA